MYKLCRITRVSKFNWIIKNKDRLVPFQLASVCNLEIKKKSNYIGFRQ